MKNTLISALISFVFVTFAAAQPGGYGPFSPNDPCLSFADDEIVFAGRVISTKWIGAHEQIPDIMREGGARVLQAEVSIEKVFKGKTTGENNVTVFTRVFRPDLEAGDSRIFNVREFINSDNTRSLVSTGWSSRLKDADKNAVFAYVGKRVGEVVMSRLSGVVVQSRNLPHVSRVYFEALTLNNTNFFRPVEGVTVKATRQKDGKVFQSKTDASGTYSFPDLDGGAYKITPVESNGFRLVNNGREEIVYILQKENEREGCRGQIDFELGKAG